MAMKRAMKSTKNTKTKTTMKSAMKRAMKSTQKAKTKTTMKSAMKRTMKSTQKDDQVFEKKWNSTYVEYVQGHPFSWKMIGITWDKGTGQVVEKWVWAAV